MCRRSESEACSRAADGEDYGDKTPWACSRRGRRPRLPSRAKLGFRHYRQAAVSYLMKTRGKITMATQFGIHLLVARVDIHAHAYCLQLRRYFVRVFRVTLADRNHNGLHGREPHREGSGVMLDEHAEKSLD